MVWYSHLFKNFPQFVVIHTVKGFGIVNKAEIDVFLELSCFLNEPVDVGNLISGSSVFSKSSLNIWKFIVHVLLKSGLVNFEKAEEPEIKLPASAGSLKNQEFQKNIYFCFIDYAKAFDCVDHNKLWKILQEMGIPDHLTCSWEICMQVKKQQLELEVKQQTGFKSGKEHVKAVYCHPAYLTYI